MLFFSDCAYYIIIISLLVLCYTVHAFLFLIFGLGIYRRVTSDCLFRFILMHPEAVPVSYTATEGITLDRGSAQ